jgi:outer membrane protein OmpA-like peptidoglycan-associated protein
MPILQQLGAETKPLLAFTMEDINTLAKAHPHGLVMFAVNWKTKLGEGIGHTLFAFRNWHGAVRIIDRTGKSVANLSELVEAYPAYAGIETGKVVEAHFIKDATIVQLIDGTSAAALEVRAILLGSQEAVEAEFGRRQMERDLQRILPAPDPIRVTSNDDSFAWILRGDMLFDFNKSDLKPASNQLLEKAWDKIKSMPRRQRVCINGFSDSVGDNAYNVRLSLRRAESVAEWFVRRGYLTRSTVKTQGLGSTLPVAPNTTPEGRARNRRVEIFVYNN